MHLAGVYILLIFMCLSNVSLGQCDWEWAKSGGEEGSESATGVAVDISGNVYVSGSLCICLQTKYHCCQNRDYCYYFHSVRI